MCLVLPKKLIMKIISRVASMRDVVVRAGETFR